MAEGIVIVVSSRYDDASHSLVTEWPGGEAVLLTAEDLSRPGWRCALPDDGNTVAVVGDKRLRREQVAGVITHWPRFLAIDVPHIRACDREFVAAETTAFLTWWLSTLSCPVLNPPSSISLCGPVWRREQWLTAGKSLGIPVTDSTRLVSASRPISPEVVGRCVVTVVGDRCVGEADAILHDHALALARHANIGLLDVHFDSSAADACLVTANVWADVGRPAVAAKLYRYFGSGER